MLLYEKSCVLKCGITGDGFHVPIPQADADQRNISATSTYHGGG